MPPRLVFLNLDAQHMETSDPRFASIPWRRLTGLPTLAALRGGRATLDRDQLVLAASLVYLTTFVLEAPLRWALALVGLAPLIYLRDAMILGLLWLEVDRSLRVGRMPRLLALALAATLFHVVIAFLQVRNLPQVLFGFKVALPLLMGIVAGIRLGNHPEKAQSHHRALKALWWVALAGLLLEATGLPLPWKGFEVEIGEFTISGNRAWTAAGIDRLAGFGRASFDTSLFLLLFFASFVFQVGRGRRWIYGALSFAGIVLTTTKVAVLAALASLGILALLSLRLPLRRPLRWVVLLACLSLSVLPPLLLRPGFLELNLDDPVIAFAFASFLERIYSTWPNGFALLHDLPFAWLGRGLGGIGSAQTYFELQTFNPGDNLFVYAWVATGAASLAYMGHLAVAGLSRRREILVGERKMRFLFVCLVFALGSTMNVVESATSLFLIGYWASLGSGRWRGRVRSIQPRTLSGISEGASLPGPGKGASIARSIPSTSASISGLT